MVGVGAIIPDENLEDYLRMAADLPEREFETTYMNGQQQKEPDDNEPSPAVGEGNDGDPTEPEGNVDKGRRTLWDLFSKNAGSNAFM
jgi:hypothetical protein